MATAAAACVDLSTALAVGRTADSHERERGDAAAAAAAATPKECKSVALAARHSNPDFFFSSLILLIILKLHSKRFLDFLLLRQAT